MPVSSPALMPTVFIGHGNPMLAITDNRYATQWQGLGTRLPRPRAVLMVSAHWYGAGTAVTMQPQPPTLHDFGGFPPALFSVQYPAPGDPELADEICGLLAPVIAVRKSEDWGLDHGSWSVLRHLYPAADVPVIQLSLDAQRSGLWHLELGRRLATLRTQGVMLIGSGNLVHHLGRINWSSDASAHHWAEEADAWFAEKIVARDFDALCNFGGYSPAARLAVPSPEHFLPLLYALGASSSADQLEFPVTGIDVASISMRCCVWSSPA